MGFWDDVKEGMQDAKYDASFEGVQIKTGRLTYKGKKYSVAECEAQVDHGANIASRITATRVAAGLVIAGPIGGLIGGLAKKNRTKVYLAINVPDDVVLVELKAKKEGDARQFAVKVNNAAAYFREKAESGANEPQ